MDAVADSVGNSKENIKVSYAGSFLSNYFYRGDGTIRNTPIQTESTLHTELRLRGGMV